MNIKSFCEVTWDDFQNNIFKAIDKEIDNCKDDYILNIVTKDGELVLLNITPKDGELILFNIITKEGKLLFDEEVIFIFILGDVIKAGRKNGEVIEIDNILASK